MRRLKTLLKQAIPKRVLNTLRSKRHRWWRSRQRAFDRRYGLDTAGIVYERELDVEEEKRRLATRYEATPRSTYLRIVRSVRLDHRLFTFVDIGSGKGAVLLYASQFPFKRIVGVEHSQRLNQIAEANIRNYRNRNIKCRDITSLCMDALAYPLPKEPLVVYLWNPFREQMLSEMVSKIERCVREWPRPLFVMSFNPAVEDVLNRSDWLRRIRTGWNHAVYESRIGDAGPLL